jgi:hypothetical protein
VVLVAVGLALIGAGVWFSTGRILLGRVSVVYDAVPVMCTGTEVSTFDPSPQFGDDPTQPEGFLRPVVALTPGMECKLRIHVQNDSWSDVTVDAVSLQYMSSDAVLNLKPERVNPNGPVGHDDPAGDTFSKTFPLMGGDIAAAGETTVLTAWFRYDGGAAEHDCSSLGWNIPTVSVSALGQTARLSPPDQDQIFMRAGTVAQCAGK